jgi:hypothetical protein
MKRLIGTIILVGLMPHLASAQSNDYSRGHGYGYFALGASSVAGTKTTHIGGGGEGFFTRNLGLGADAGYLAPFGGFSSDGIGTFSPNFVTRFRAQRKENKVEPLATAGYTLFV